PCSREKIQRAARQVTKGPVGVGLAFIHHVWEILKMNGEAPSLDEFKHQLLELSRQNQVHLERIEAPYAFDPKDIQESQISDGQTAFAFMRIERAA
ncbi:MAG: hypothetical protein KTR25_10600, partial [Myxococcales bacterium]|nr:hypothetical protein [Myxococcales bacterium]